MSLISGVPVSAMSSGRPGALADPLGQREDVPRALRGLVLDEVRLVDDHPAEAEVAEPAPVAVEHLVVDDDDVGETVDVSPSPWTAVAGRCGTQRAASRTQLVLTTLGTTTSSGKASAASAASRACGGLAQTGLVGQQEGPVAGRGRRDDLPLVRHQLLAAGVNRAVGAGSVMEAGAPAPARSNELSSGPSSSQPARRRGRAWTRPGRREVGREERVGQLPGGHRQRHDAALGGGGLRRPRRAAPPRAAPRRRRPGAGRA